MENEEKHTGFFSPYPDWYSVLIEAENTIHEIISCHNDDKREQKLIDALYVLWIRQYNYQMAVATQTEINPKAHWHEKGFRVEEKETNTRPRINNATKDTTQ